MCASIPSTGYRAQSTRYGVEVCTCTCAVQYLRRVPCGACGACGAVILVATCLCFTMTGRRLNPGLSPHLSEDDFRYFALKQLMFLLMLAFTEMEEFLPTLRNGYLVR